MTQHPFFEHSKVYTEGKEGKLIYFHALLYPVKQGAPHSFGEKETCSL